MQMLVAFSPSGAPDPQVPSMRPAYCCSVPVSSTFRMTAAEGLTSLPIERI